MFHPASDATEDALGNVFLEEGHTSLLGDDIGQVAAERGAGSCDGYEKNEVGVLGRVEDHHDVGYAGNGERDEGTVDNRDEKQADETEREEKVNEVTMATTTGMMRREKRGGRSEQRESEERGRGRDKHVR